MKKYSYLLGVLVVFSVLFWLIPSYAHQSEAFQKAVLQTRDVFFKVRQLSSAPPDKIREILILRIDEESCDKLQQRWPWSRRTFAAMIDNLQKRGARVVGLNVSFTGLEDGSDASSEALADAMKRHGNVVVGATFDSENRLVRPSPLIAEAASRYGYLEKIIDPDFSIRRSYLLRPYVLKRSIGDSSSFEREDRFENSFPLQLLAVRSGSSKAGDAQHDPDLGLVTVGVPHVGVYVDEEGSYTINYVAAESDFAQIPAWRAVQGRITDAEVKGKVVLVGLTSSLFSDMHPTPLGLMSGIAIHANEYLSILSSRNLRFAPDPLTYAISWLIGLCVTALFLSRRFWLGMAGLAVAAAGLFLGAEAAFFHDYVIEPFLVLLGPMLGGVVGVVGHSLKLFLENRGLEKRVIHDKMTGLYKYEYLRECLEEEWKRCHKSNLPVSVVMTDLDRFKTINDTLGHETGNEMIRRAGVVIKDSARRYDIVSRYGGDEFVILLWHATFEEAKAYRERLRESYHAMARALDQPLLKDSSISIGVATFDPKVDTKYPPDTQRLIEDADKDLFLDKQSRRKKGEETR